MSDAPPQQQQQQQQQPPPPWLFNKTFLPIISIFTPIPYSPIFKEALILLLLELPLLLIFSYSPLFFIFLHIAIYPNIFIIQKNTQKIMKSQASGFINAVKCAAAAIKYKSRHIQMEIREVAAFSMFYDDIYCIKHSFPLKANPYFLIWSGENPSASSFASYFFSSICAWAFATVCARSSSFEGL